MPGGVCSAGSEATVGYKCEDVTGDTQYLLLAKNVRVFIPSDDMFHTSTAASSLCRCPIHSHAFFFHAGGREKQDDNRGGGAH